MDSIHSSLRDGVTAAVCCALQPLPSVFAAWEGGSVAFDAVDEYSDLDLNFLVDDAVSCAELYAPAERAIEAVSPITASHSEPPGRYYKLEDGGDFFLVDLCFIRSGAADRCLAVERHGRIRPLFDKGEWLRGSVLDEAALRAARTKRRQELEEWFTTSQSFVRKAILRGKEAEALAAYWGYTLKPLVQLLRMRHCPERWDFGMRYLERDLPEQVYNELLDLTYVREPAELRTHLDRATAWGQRLLHDVKKALES